MTPDPPKIEKNKFVLKCILDHFQCFEQFLFLVENRPPNPPSQWKISVIFFKPFLRLFWAILRPSKTKYWNFISLASKLGKVKKNQWNFSLRGGGWGIRIGRFSTKKNTGSQQQIRPNMHFKPNLFFSTDHLKLLTSLVRPSCNCSPTHIIQNPFCGMQIIFG